MILYIWYYIYDTIYIWYYIYIILYIYYTIYIILYIYYSIISWFIRFVFPWLHISSTPDGVEISVVQARQLGGCWSKRTTEECEREKLIFDILYIFNSSDVISIDCDYRLCIIDYILYIFYFSTYYRLYIVISLTNIFDSESPPFPTKHMSLLFWP